MTAIDAVLRHCDASHDRHLDQLFTLLRQPSVSTQGIGVDERTGLVRDLLETSGFAETVYPTPGWSVVYGERIVNADLPTLLVYFMIGGDEESGSPSFESLVREHGNLLRTDLVYGSDRHVHDAE